MRLFYPIGKHDRLRDQVKQFFQSCSLHTVLKTCKAEFEQHITASNQALEAAKEAEKAKDAEIVKWKAAHKTEAEAKGLALEAKDLALASLQEARDKLSMKKIKLQTLRDAFAELKGKHEDLDKELASTQQDLINARDINNKRNALAMAPSNLADITTSFLRSSSTTCDDKLAKAEADINELKRRYYERDAIPRIVDTINDGGTVFYKIQVGVPDIISADDALAPPRSVTAASTAKSSMCVFRRNKMFMNFASRLTKQPVTGQISSAIATLSSPGAGGDSEETERILILKLNLEALAAISTRVAIVLDKKVRQSEFEKILRNLFEVQNAYRSIRNKSALSPSVKSTVDTLKDALVAFLADSHEPKFEGEHQLSTQLREAAESICNAPERERLTLQEEARKLIQKRKTAAGNKV